MASARSGLFCSLAKGEHRESAKGTQEWGMPVRHGRKASQCYPGVPAGALRAMRLTPSKRKYETSTVLSPAPLTSS